MNPRFKAFYFLFRLNLLLCQFLFYKEVIAHESESSMRLFVASSSIISLLGVTDFGLSVGAQRLFATRRKSLGLLGSLFGLARSSLIMAILYSFLASFFILSVSLSSDITSFLPSFFLILFLIFILNIAFLLAATLTRIAFSSSVHGYIATLTMSVGPLFCLILLRIGRELDLYLLANPSFVLLLSAIGSFSLCIVYNFYFYLRWRPLAALHAIFERAPCLENQYDTKPRHDWLVGSLGLLTLQADSIIIIFVDPSGLSSYFLAAKIVSVFAFFTSLGLPRVFSSVAEKGGAPVISSSLAKYLFLSRAVPVISFLSTLCYLSWADILSANGVFVAILLSLTLGLRILTDLYSCILQSVGLSRELILYLPAQAILTVVLGFVLGRFYGSIGVAVSQFAGFALVAYPWLRSVFRKRLGTVKT